MNVISVFLKGFAMGAANVIPGVSGGTVAFITGIYERLINAIKSFDIQAIKLLKNREFGALLKHVDFSFLAVLCLGVVVSIASMAKVLAWAYEEHEVYVSALFFGLIAMSIYSVAKMVKKWSIVCFFALIIGCAAAVGLAFIEQSGESTNFLYLMLCGAIAMCCMILPGVSGSFILILLGNYFLILNSVNELRAGAFDKALPIIIPVGIGAVVGIAALSRFLSWLFKKYHDVTTSLIAGFVAGSLFVIWPWKTPITKLIGEKVKVVDYTRYLPDFTEKTSLFAVGFILLGALAMIIMEFIGKKKNKLS
ncbi:DUF368 domain-containing protein [Akkermansiaceae bacterium]|nr:DUF368 domain-containing protein [Akkermansiaceae bacterium]